MELYSNNQCPTCGSDLHTEHHKSIKDNLEESLQSKEDKKYTLVSESSCDVIDFEPDFVWNQIRIII